MTLDLKIKGATVVDGSGAKRFNANIGICGGRIAELGQVSSAARREIDVDGALATPGFIDMHTHYDAQVLWDSELLASSRNGVTTAIMGNCGVGCAPYTPDIRSELISLLEGVEDIPKASLEVALDRTWGDFASYLATVEERPHTINLAANVTHAPMRMVAMGARAFDGSEPTDRDIEAMRSLLAEALDAGAMAFSTDRIGLHQTGDGRHVPDFRAPRREIMALAKAVAAYPGRPIQFASDFGQIRDEEDTIAELALLREVASLGMPVFAPLQQYPCAGGWRRLASDIAAMNRDGARIVFEASARAIGVLLGLEALVHPFCRHPSYVAIAGLPLEQRVASMLEPGFRERLLAEEPVFRREDARVRRRFEQMYREAGHIFPVESTAVYEPDPATSVLSIAQREGRTLEEIFFDVLTADGGKRYLYFPIANFADGRLDEQHGILSLDNTVLSFGDAGAHLAQICDAAYSTFALTHWGRDRASGLPLEQLVYKMTGMQADLFGLAGRGRIAVGELADINLIDHAALRLENPVMLHDLPGGASRLLQCAKGYIATLVKGIPIAENDVLTGTYPGNVLRRQASAA